MNDLRLGVSLRESMERFLYALVAVVLPLAGIAANSVLNLGGVLLTILLAVWMGFAVVILSPFLE